MDKLQGTWVFDKVARIEPTGYITTSWNVVFVSNGKAFKSLVMTGDTENIHLTNQTRSLTYIAENIENSVYVIRPGYADYTAYMTIEIISKYDEVENADTLLQALTARASFTPNTSEDIHIPMTSVKGAILKTGGKYCEKDIVVTPTFEIHEAPNIQPLTVTENGIYTAPDGVEGYSPIAVEVASSGSGDSLEGHFDGSATEISLPNTTKIKDYCFYRDTIIRDIVMPKVTSIGQYAFSNCSNLNLSLLPSGLKSLSIYCFAYCSNLALTELPSGITYIPNNAFASCSKLALSSLPSGITSIGSSAFSTCTNLALTSLPSGMSSIGDYAFEKCTNLALTSLPSGITSLGSRAFSNCTNLALTSLPSGITSISGYTFDGCTNLALTSLPSGLRTIGFYAFRNCTNLALTEIPSAVTTVESSAFDTCTGLTSITFKGTPTTINSSAFTNCTNLTTINVPWAEGAKPNAPWGATNATINYNYTGG